MIIPFKKALSDSSSMNDKQDTNEEISKTIKIFKSQREKLEISLEELSNKTKISRNVLIAIENGWEKYLPEYTYLITMLKILEIELNLERGSLNGLLAKKTMNNSLSKFKFNFINIDFLNSWTGSLLYFIIMLFSILAINSQQKYLLKIHSISTEPVFINETNIENDNINNIQK
jgi:cytoskeletal protein RodZ